MVVEASEGNRRELFAHQAFPFLAQHGQVINAGGRLGWRRRVKGQAGLDTGLEVHGLGLGKELVVEPDLQTGQVEGIVA